jgi:hypothetical protein
MLLLSDFLKYFVLDADEIKVEIGCLCGCLSIQSNVGGHAVCIISSRHIEPIIIYQPIIYALRQEMFSTNSSESQHLIRRKKKKIEQRLNDQK